MNPSVKHSKKTKKHLEAYCQAKKYETKLQVILHESKRTEKQSSTTKNNKMTTQTEKSKENSIFIGGKPFMNYVTGVIVQFNKDAEEVTIKARGKFITKGVDVAEVARRKFLQDKNVSVKDVSIGSEEFENKEGKMINVSTLEIILRKN